MARRLRLHHAKHQASERTSAAGQKRNERRSSQAAAQARAHAPVRMAESRCSGLSISAGLPPISFTPEARVEPRLVPAAPAPAPPCRKENRRTVRVRVKQADRAVGGASQQAGRPAHEIEDSPAAPGRGRRSAAAPRPRSWTCARGPARTRPWPCRPSSRQRRGPRRGLPSLHEQQRELSASRGTPMRDGRTNPDSTRRAAADCSNRQRLTRSDAGRGPVRARRNGRSHGRVVLLHRRRLDRAVRVGRPHVAVCNA